jgi:hypothetical protein
MTGNEHVTVKLHSDISFFFLRVLTVPDLFSASKYAIIILFTFCSEFKYWLNQCGLIYIVAENGLKGKIFHFTS